MTPRGQHRRPAPAIAALVAYIVIASLVSVTESGLVSQAVAQTSIGEAIWVPTGGLHTPRVGHTATLLRDGRVLVVGGRNASNLLDSAELYDPATGTWSITGHMNVAKDGHTATMLPGGHVLVVGYTDNPSDGAEVYDPGTGAWSFISNGEGAWRDHTATLLPTGTILFAGGWAHPYSSYSHAALFDPATGSWKRTGNLITERGAYHRATLLQDGRVLVTGGTRDADFAWGLRYAEVYDASAGTWSHVADLQVPRLGHSATLLPDGRVLVAGGDSLEFAFGYPARTSPPTNTSEMFDPASATWSSTANLNAGRSGHTATLLPNGDVLVAGGHAYEPSGWGGSSNSAERYDASAAAWRSTGDLNVARAEHTATLLENGRVLVVGGTGGSSSAELGSAELYGPGRPGTIVSGFTGAWYDPSQNGHGLFVEVLADSRFLAAWFTFNPAGTQQAWFVGAGTYSGNIATITDVYQTTGGRWIPNFDPSGIVNNRWGTLTFTFTDCGHGKVDFDSVLGYGSGSMNLTRLTQPAGLSCP